MPRIPLLLSCILATVACATAPAPLSDRAASLSMHDFMKTIIDPAANAVFDAGNAEDASKVSPGQWKALLEGAGVLQESGRLLLLHPHANPDPEWKRTAELMVAAGADAAAAATARNHDAAFEAGGKLYEACNGCHSKFVHGKS